MTDSKVVVQQGVMGNARKWKQTLPGTKVKLTVGDWNGNRRTQKRSFCVRDAIIAMS